MASAVEDWEEGETEREIEGIIYVRGGVNRPAPRKLAAWSDNSPNRPRGWFVKPFNNTRDAQEWLNANDGRFTLKGISSSSSIIVIVTGVWT